MRARFAEVFASKDRDHWATVFAGTDACVTPVLSFAEVQTNRTSPSATRSISTATTLLPSPAPRFSRSVPPTPKPLGEPGADTEAVLRDWV